MNFCQESKGVDVIAPHPSHNAAIFYPVPPNSDFNYFSLDFVFEWTIVPLFSLVPYLAMWLLNVVHDIIDRALALVKLAQNREVGWETINRKTGQYKREQQPIYKKLKLLFLFNPIMTWFDRTHLLRLWIHDKTIEAGKIILLLFDL